MADDPVKQLTLTPNLRMELGVIRARQDPGEEVVVGAPEMQYVANGRFTTPEERIQAEFDAQYINWLIETDELRRSHIEVNQAGLRTDVLVDLGNMKGADIRQVNLQDEAYESMVEDILGNFNHIVTQGIRPIVALHAMGFGFAIALGACLRANLPDNQADALLFIIRNNAKIEGGRVKLVTQQ